MKINEIFIPTEKKLLKVTNDLHNFTLRQKFKENFDKSFTKHIDKLNSFREKIKIKGAPKTIDQKIIESIIKKNFCQMQNNKRKQIDCIKMVGKFVDNEIIQQETTIDNLLDSFENMLNCLKV